MSEKNKSRGQTTRREFVKALGALATVSIVPRHADLRSADQDRAVAAPLA